jgi:hypothetical protein
MKSLALAALLVPLALLAGCADVDVTTEVRADGSWARRLVFRMDAKDPMGEKGDFSKTFDLPKGEGWSAKEGTEGKKMTYTAERAGKKGEVPASDLLVKSKKGTVSVSNEVSLREVAPGRWEYRETIRWKGPKPADYLKPEPEQVEWVKSALPAGLADDAKAVEVLQAVQRVLYRELLGPGDPLLAQMLLHPRLGERRLKAIIGDAVAPVLKNLFGDKLTDAQRTQAARKIAELPGLSNVQEKAESKQPGGGGGKEEKDEPDFVPLSFTLKVPGKIVSANGEVDAASGEVFWAFYAQSAQLEDVVLSATFELK